MALPLATIIIITYYRYELSEYLLVKG